MIVLNIYRNFMIVLNIYDKPKINISRERSLPMHLSRHIVIRT